MSSAPYAATIGLEVHVQLATQTKIFCGCATRFGAAPNTQICPVCSGQPGALPVLNAEAVAHALRLALALGCTVRRESRFARKNYFYPDLPKGYQISQYDEPLAEGGAVEFLVDDQPQRVPLVRIHLEEDAGKTMHQAHGASSGRACSLVDLNRAGVPLAEIVSAPAIHSPAAAAEYMRALRGVARALGVSDGNMEQGSLRCDANISLAPAGSAELGTKVEIKNLNSFRFVQRALEHEIERQSALLARGETIAQQTRLFDAERGVTEPLRSKEEAHDYRYFPEPDLPPLVVDERWLAALAAALPELPHARRARFVAELGLGPADAAALTRERELADYFEQTLAAGAQPKRAASWLLTELLARVAEPREVAQAAVSPTAVAELLALVESGEVSGKLAKEIWARMWQSGRGARAIAEAEGLFQQSDEAAIAAVIAEVLAAHPESVAGYRAGKTKLLGFLVGQVMRATDGKANPQLVNAALRRRLDEGGG